MRTPFRCTVELPGDGAAIVTVVGDLDLATATQFAEAVASSPPLRLFNLSETTFIDSRGVRALLLASGDARPVPEVIGATGPARRALELIGADQMFEMHNSVSSSLDVTTS
jgi:anti-anti-sigma regulatory factor